MAGTSRLTNLKVRAKILSGFGCVLVILAFVGGTGLITLMRIDNAAETVAQRTGVFNIASDIKLKFTIARRFVREFAHTGDPDMATQGDAALVKSKEAVDLALAKVRNPERQAKIREIAEVLQSYAKSFDRVKAEMKEARALQLEVLDPSGLKLTENFETLSVAAAQTENITARTLARDNRQILMEARLDANKALGRHDDAQASKADESFARLNRALQGFATALST